MATVTAPVPSTHAQPCPCGCAPCPDECCELECLIRPRFFCGQLLTDEDLGALVEWSDRRHRLARFRHGWGVVCGMQVQPDPETPAAVRIAPGYALDCCGRDLIVCSPVSLDLGAACAAEAGPCGVPEQARAAQRQAATEATAPGAELTGAMWSKDLDGKTPFTYHDVDVLVRYAEQPAALQAALARGACTETVGCEPTRSQEGVDAWWEPASAALDRDAAITLQWLAAYDETVRIVERFCKAFPLLCGDGDVAQPEQVGREVCVWFMNRLEEQPLQHFAAVRDRILELPRSALIRRDVLVELLFWIVQDRRNTLALCGCDGCAADVGVPLARVRLRQWNDPSGARRCAVAWISTHAPHRREVGSDRWPADPGEVNLARVLWRAPGQACTILTDLGLRVPSIETLQLPAMVADLQAALTCRPFADCGGDVRLQIFGSPLGGPRVVGFCGANGDDSTAAKPAAKRRTSSNRKPRSSKGSV